MKCVFLLKNLPKWEVFSASKQFLAILKKIYIIPLFIKKIIKFMKYNLDSLLEEFANLEAEMSDPSIYSDQKRLREVASKKKRIEEPVELYREYKACYESLEEAKIMMEDPEMKELALEEKKEAEKKIPDLEERLKIALLPKDPNDDKNILLEVRAGAGWEEAALFAWELARGYMNFASERGFKIEIIEQSDAEAGWLKEIIIKIEWEGAYSIFKFEGWTHRVQRIPATESKGRVHTSAVTVAVMPEVDDIDIEIKDEDIKMDFFRASWAGGQHVNKTESAVRLTHIPTWVVAECQDWRSQHANRDKAYQVLKARIYAAEEEKRAKELWEARLAQVGSGDRSEKIRTYNFPQDRITDHRIGQNFSGIPGVMTWKFGAIIESLQIADQAQKLEAASSGK